VEDLMPLFTLLQLECDKCGASIPVKSRIDLMLRKPQEPTLRPCIIPDPDFVVIVAEKVVSPDPAHWLIAPGYPDTILCPNCRPQAQP
jgi:hypothetical protein